MIKELKLEISDKHISSMKIQERSCLILQQTQDLFLKCQKNVAKNSLTIFSRKNTAIGGIMIRGKVYVSVSWNNRTCLIPLESASCSYEQFSFASRRYIGNGTK